MNIFHGESAGGLFMQAFEGAQGEVVVFHDELSCGPLMKYTDLQTWRVFRENYWNSVYRDSATVSLSYEVLERDFYSRFVDFEATHDYRLWIGTGLSDQLLLAFLVNLIESHGSDLRSLSVYQFERVPGQSFEIQGLGLLRPNQIRDNCAPYVLNEKRIRMAKLAWEAVTESDPEKYLLYMSSDDDSLPLLKKAMASVLYRYPKASNGLSYWDETLLECTAKHGPSAASIIAHAIADCFHSLDVVGDVYLFSRLKALGRPNLCQPLVKLNAFDLPIRETKVNILPSGIKALSENLNVIKENGIDDWVGGVHLDSSSGTVWVRRSGTPLSFELLKLS